MKSAIRAAAVMLAAPAPVLAQEPQDTFRLGAVVVTATRLPTPAAAVPIAVTVVDGEALRQRGIRTVAEALRTVPGIAVIQSAGPGALTSVFMRGGESDYVQVLVDGVQVNDPGGAFNWAHLRTEDIDRIEVVRGPASVLYGSDAVVGVIQIFTRAGGAPRVTAGWTGGRGSRLDADEPSYTHAFDVSLTSGAGVDAFAGASLLYGVTAARTAADGLYAYNSEYDNTGLSARLGIAATRFDLTASLRHGSNEYHYPTSGSGAVVDRNQFATGRTRSVGVDGGVRLTPAVELRLLATDYDAGGDTRNPPDDANDGSFVSENTLMRRTLDARVNAQLPISTVFTIGAEHERQSGTTFFESVSSFGTFADTTDDERTNTGWYAQLHGQPLHTVSLTVGARIDRNSVFGDFRTARAAASWRVHERSRVRAAAGSAFKEPTFFENFATGFARGNPDLQPEESRSWEVGAEHTLRGTAVTLAATWFDQQFRNLIQYTFAPPSPDAPNFFNVGEARARGVELEARAAFSALAVRGSYTYTDAVATDEGFGSDQSFQQDQPLLRRPRHQAAIGVATTLLDRLRASIDARFTGQREDVDFTDPASFGGKRVTLDSYVVLDGGIGYDLAVAGAMTELSLRVRNLFDTEYQEIYNFPTEGRVLQLQVRTALPF